MDMNKKVRIGKNKIGAAVYESIPSSKILLI